MVEVLNIHLHADRKRIVGKIRTKANGCGFPSHWIFREPIRSSEQMWLRPQDLDKKRGSKVPVRRVLFYLEYKILPLKQITMVCDEPKLCCNPAHMRIRGFEAECNERIERQIEKGWLRPEDAKAWFGWDNKHNMKLPEDYDPNLGRLGD